MLKDLFICTPNDGIFSESDNPASGNFLIAIVIAIIIGLGLGILISRYRHLCSPVLGLTNFIYTIPTIAFIRFPDTFFRNRKFHRHHCPHRVRLASDGPQHLYRSDRY